MEIKRYYRAVVMVAAAVLSVTAAKAQMDLSPTKYDWSGLSNSITEGCTSNYDKFYAIYRWLCDNIAYDTTYKIHSADECYEARRGVCQAYSEMFCRLAEAEGLKAEIVSGYSKSDNQIDRDGHAWVFAYTDPSINQGILIDPTWGAGSVDHGVFKRNRHNDTWFHVDPKWMIFTHYPDQGKYQLLGDTITIEQFNRLPDLKPFLKLLSFDPAPILQAELAGRHVELPTCYYSCMDDFGIRQARLPQERAIRVGTPVEVVLDADFDPSRMRALGDGCGPSLNSGEWVRQGKYIHGRFIPARPGELKIGVKNNEGSYTTLAEYHVLTPGRADYDRLESAMPELSPVWDGLGNVYMDVFKQKGVDIAQLLATVKREGIESLPILYPKMRYGVQRIPWHEDLKVGQTYVFEFLPYEGINCAIINGNDNDKEWLTDWQTDAKTGAWCMTVTPQKRGTLTIAIQSEPEGSYSSCIKYNVK